VNYYQAREMKDADGKPTGKWHYTVRNDDRIYPVGLCALDCPGHDTKEGAYAHYRTGLLDQAHYGFTYHDAMFPCEVCGEYTKGFAQTSDEQFHTLCDAHRNREGLDKVLTVGDAISS
jgi:hypothetical protein